MVGFLGFLKPVTVHAFPMYGWNNGKVPAKYAFAPKWNGSGTSVMTPFGTYYNGNLYASLGDPACYGFKAGSNTLGNYGVKITNVGWYNNRSVDLKCTVTRISGNDNNMHVRFAKRFTASGTFLELYDDSNRWGRWFEIRFDFTWSDTGEPAVISSHFHLWSMTYLERYWVEDLDRNTDMLYKSNDLNGDVYGDGRVIYLPTDDSAGFIGQAKICFTGSTYRISYGLRPGGDPGHKGCPQIEFNGTDSAADPVNIWVEWKDIDTGDVKQSVSSNVTPGSSPSQAITVIDGYSVVGINDDGTEKDQVTGTVSWPRTYADHHLIIWLRAKYNIVTEITNGSITDSITGILRGSQYIVDYTPNEGYYVDSVTVDGYAVDTGAYPSRYVFADIQVDHKISVVCKIKTYSVNTYVRWRGVNGDFSEWQNADSVTRTHGSSYSYTWVRNALRSEPENVYYDGNPKTVGTDSVTSDLNYYITVERKKYTYAFKPNPPAGYAAVGNLQQDLTDKWAETVSGSVKSPTLTGYTFLGWNTASDGSGSWYTSESMLSNKTFYAIWRKNKYQVHYDPNGSSNPDHLPGEFTQNTVLGSMADSQYEYDTKGSFRTNAFTRAGYEFIGWNTKADGTGAAYGESPYDLSGKYYSNGYANVYNMTATDGKVLTVYAQWRKKLGTDRLTVVSEETGNPVANVGVNLQKNVNGSWVDVASKTTDANGVVSLGDLHWYNYRWVCTSVPDGYQKLSDVGFTIKHDHLEQADVRTLFMKRVILVLHSTVDAVISGESVPSFAYKVSGTDAAGVRHGYVMDVTVDRASLKGDSKALSLYAGNYDVTQVPISRYVPGNAVNVLGGQVSGINGKALLLTNDRCELKFPYTIDQYGGLGSMDHKENGFRTNMVFLYGLH